MSKLTQLSALVFLIGATTPTLNAVLDDPDLLRAGVPQKKLTVRLQHVSEKEQNTKETESSVVLTHKTSLDKAQERMKAANDQQEKEAKGASIPAPQVVSKLEDKVDKEVKRFFGHLRKGRF